MALEKWGGMHESNQLILNITETHVNNEFCLHTGVHLFLSRHPLLGIPVDLTDMTLKPFKGHGIAPD